MAALCICGIEFATCFDLWVPHTNIGGIRFNAADSLLASHTDEHADNDQHLYLGVLERLQTPLE